MAGTTEFYAMAFFDFGDSLTSELSVNQEINRFVLIDRQLYAYYSVFGDGIFSGWNITDGGNLTVIVTPGVGIISSYAVESTYSYSITNLPPNSVVYIYAQIDPTTVLDRDVVFNFSSTPITSDALLLAVVTTSASGISNIDTSVQVSTGFQQIVNNAIQHHRHDGITAPKIDLTQEVQGQLPMSRLANLDASKLTGLLPNNVLPPIDHTTLQNIGTLTHPQLDSFAQSIQTNNAQLFGEVTSINLMKMTLALKYQYANVDQFYENMLCVIPGITPDSFIDFINTNAYIDEYTNCVSGIPNLESTFSNIGSGSASSENINNLQIVTVPWETDQDFMMASAISNLTISNGVQLSPDTTNSRILDSFDEGIAGNSDTGYVANLKQTNAIFVKYDTNSAQGPLAGRFEIQTSSSGVFTKSFAVAQDWSSYDTLSIYVQSSMSNHSPVTLQILDANNNQLASFLLLASDEVTTLNSAAVNGFVQKSFSISGFTRNNVGSLVFSTGTITNQDEYFLIDTIALASNTYLLPQGNIKLRYNTTNPVVFNSIDYDTTVPSGTSVLLRVRVADSLVELATAAYTSLLTSGQAFSLAGTYIEIDITLLSDVTLKLTPVLTSVLLTILVPAQQSGLSITSASDWQQGVLTNISIDSNGVVSMAETNVGDIYFINGQNVTELDPYLIPIAGVTAIDMPIAPYQGYAALNPSAQIPNEYNPGREFLSGLFNPKSVVRLAGGNFLVADSGNDRFMEFTSNGTFVRGFASHNNTALDTSLYALTSNYNPRLGVLFITFSMTVDIKYADLTTITLSVNGTQIQLSNTVDQVRDVGSGNIISRPDLSAFLDGTSGNYSGIADNILSIVLSPDKQALIAANPGAQVSIFITGNPSPATNATIGPQSLGGLTCFVGDYMYFGNGGIWNPICAIQTEEDSYAYCNAIISEQSTTLAPSGVVSVVEIKKAIGSVVNGVNLGSTFTYSGMVFSDIMLGSILYFTTSTETGQTERKLLISGLTTNGTLSLSGTSSSSSSSSSGASSGGSYIGITDGQKLSQFTGQTAIVNMGSGLQEWIYFSPDGMFPSDAYFDTNGNVVVAESSLYPQTGRIITVDSLGTVIKLIQNGMYTKIWNIAPQPNGNIFVST